MVTHHKKTWPDYFQMLLDGRKKFDIRLADFEVKEGDTIVFEEWDPDTKKYTGRKIKMTVTLVVKTKELPYWNEVEVKEKGFLIMQVEDTKK